MFRSTTALALGSLLFLTPMAHGDLVVLQYHHVSNTTPAATSTTPSLFEAQLDMIRDLDLDVAPLEEATRAALAGELETTQKVAITFDDAYESVWDTALPALRQRGMPFAVFVNTDAIGSHGYMTWEQLEQLRDMEGVEIANHTADHGHLVQRPDESEATWQQRVRASLDAAQNTLHRRLDTDEPMLAYPYGEFDSKLEALVSDRNWYGYGQQSGAIGATSAPTRLPRFPMATAYGQLNNLPDKLRSRALPVDAARLPDGTVDHNPPELVFTLPERLAPGRLSCFASGRGRLEVDHRGGGTVSIQASTAFDSRRFRYNCTYPAGDGRFYWLSQQWLDLSQPED